MGDVWGGGLVVLAAAALWLIYLIPTWLRRREYLATERNAVRLQQTLRILAETAEVPEQVRLEANARTVAEQQKLLREAEARAAAVARAQADAKAAEDALAAAQATARAQATAAAARAAMPVVRTPVVRMPASVTLAAEPVNQTVRTSSPVTGTEAVDRRRRIRRARASVSLLLLLSLLGAVFGVYAALALATWLVLAVALVVALGCVITLSSLARSTHRAAVVRSSAPSRAATELFDHADHAETAAEVPVTTWTPRPLPKPLYQSQGTVAASAMASVDAAAALRRSAAAADLARRAAELAPPVPQLHPAAAPASGLPVRAGSTTAEAPVASAAPSRFASMGIVTGAEGASIDLDAALRRRRAAG